MSEIYFIDNVSMSAPPPQCIVEKEYAAHFYWYRYKMLSLVWYCNYMTLYRILSIWRMQHPLYFLVSSSNKAVKISQWEFSIISQPFTSQLALGSSNVTSLGQFQSSVLLFSETQIITWKTPNNTAGVGLHIYQWKYFCPYYFVVLRASLNCTHHFIDLFK